MKIGRISGDGQVLDLPMVSLEALAKDHHCAAFALTTIRPVTLNAPET